jgi:hypothetical protein
VNHIHQFDPVYERSSVTVKGLPRRQKGAATFSSIIMIAVVAYAGFVGIQYVPQIIESKSIDTILDDIERNDKRQTVTNTQVAFETVISMLQTNEMNDMTDSFTVKEINGRINITFSYDRELNLLFKKQPMHYSNTLIL